MNTFFLCQGHTSPGVHQANSSCPSTASSSGIGFQEASLPCAPGQGSSTGASFCASPTLLGVGGSGLGLTAGCSLVARLGLATEQVLSKGVLGYSGHMQCHLRPVLPTSQASFTSKPNTSCTEAPRVRML